MNSQELRSLQEAYLDVCENSLLNAIDSTARNVAGDIGGGIGERQAKKKTGNIPIVSDIAGTIGRNQGTQKGQEVYDKVKQTAIGAVGGLLKQSYEYDLFDYILEYLVAEGYADTNENAIAIMSNMSEEWRQSIVEDTKTVLASQKGVAGAVKVNQTRTPGFLGTGIGSKTISTPIPGTFTRNTPGRLKSGPREFDAFGSGSRDAEAEMGDRSGPTDAERARYNSYVTQNNTVGDMSVTPSPRAVNLRAKEKGHSGLMPIRDPNGVSGISYTKPNDSWRNY